MSQVAVAARSGSRGLNAALWVVQVVVGVLFIFAGLTKSAQPMETLAQMMPWTAQMGVGMTRFIGISELLGGIGLLLPSLTRIQPKLTPLAALGLVVVMILAAGFHVTRSEFGAVPSNFIIAGLAAFVAWGRGIKAPISKR